MNMTLNKRWCLTAILALSAVVYTSSSFAATDRLVIESGDSAQSRQQASMEKEQWNDTRSLRQNILPFRTHQIGNKFLSFFISSIISCLAGPNFLDREKIT